MGALSPWHWAILIVVLVLLFGAKRLPDAARSLGKSKIDELDLEVRRDQQVLRLHIEMNESAIVEVIERLRDLLQQPGRILDRIRTVGGDLLFQRSSGNVLEDSPWRFVVFEQIVDTGDVRVCQKGHRARFAAKSRARFRIFAIFDPEGFERYFPARAQVAAAIHHGHAARTQRLLEVDLVVAGDDRSSLIAPRKGSGVVEGHLVRDRSHP